MTLSKYTKDTAVIENVGTDPEDRINFNDTTFKRKWDENATDWKEFFNSTASIEIDALIATLNSLISTVSGTVSSNLALLALTLYVSPTGSDTTGDGSSAKPYATISKALSIIPKNLGAYGATIRVAAGTYTDSPIISNFTGYQVQLQLDGNVTLNGRVTVSNNSCTVRITCGSYTLIINTSTNNIAFNIAYTPCFIVTGSGLSINHSGGNNGIYITNSLAQIDLPVTINNAVNAIVCGQPSIAFINSVAGTGNTVAYISTASELKIGTSTITAGTKIIKSNGGTVKTGAGVDLT